MRLKSFYAKTMTEAMQMVRQTLGEDAIIVATREENGGKAVRITAAIDPQNYDERETRPARNSASTPSAAPAARSGQGFQIRDEDSESPYAAAAQERDRENNWLQYDEEDDSPSVAEEITDAMLHHGLPEDVMDHVISCATVIGLENPGVSLIAALEHLFTFRPLPTKRTPKPIMMIGPPGAGKTLAVAKLATRTTMNAQRVGVITCDTVRAGGIEQIQGFTNLLRSPLLTAGNPQELARNIEVLQTKGADQIIIDTPGINPFNTEDVRMLARLINTSPVEAILVMPAGMDADECGDMARAFAAMGAHSILSTRIDMARRLGGLLSAAHHGSLAFTDASNTPKVADGLYSLTPKTLAKLLMPRAYAPASPQSQNTANRTEQHRRTGT